MPDVAAFCAQLDDRAVPSSFLVAPRLKGGYRLDRDRSTVDWLAGRRTRGDAIVLHGFDEAATKKRRGEFATLPAHEANLRLTGADRVLEHLGLRTRLFAAPGWTVSQGTLDALPRNGFRLLAGLGGITDLVRGTTTRTRVLGIGEGFLSEPWWCRTLVMSADRTARRDGRRAGCGGGAAPTQTGAPPGHARCRRPVSDASVHACRLRVAAPSRADRCRLTDRYIGGHG